MQQKKGENMIKENGLSIESKSIIDKVVDEMTEYSKDFIPWKSDYNGIYNTFRFRIGFSAYEKPAAAIKFYNKVCKVLNKHDKNKKLICIFNDIDIDLKEKDKLQKEDLIEIEESKKKMHFYSQYFHNIDAIIAELREQTHLETFGHLVNPTFSSNITDKTDCLNYKNTDLSDSFVYHNYGKKEFAMACIENIKRIFNKHGDFDFIISDKKSDFNGYWCVFIKNKDKNPEQTLAVEETLSFVETQKFCFESELFNLGLSEDNFNTFLEEEEHFSEEGYDIEQIKKIYILQERTMQTMRELDIEGDANMLSNAMTNLILNY